MDPTRLLERLQPDPYQAGLRRLTRRLAVDAAVVRYFRRAAGDGDPAALAAYAWAVGVAPEDAQVAGPLSAARAYEQAADGAPNDPAVQFGSGLAHAGGFGRRRGLPLNARRGFSNAAKLDPDNALPHLALAVARLSTGGRDQADESLAHAFASARYEPYDSPVAAPVRESAPWLGGALAALWPERVSEVHGYLLDAMLTDAAVAGSRKSAVRAALARIGGLGRLLAERGPDRPGVLLGSLGMLLAAARARRDLLDEPRAEALREALVQTALDLLHSQRDLGRELERRAGQTVRWAGAGIGAGLCAAVAGGLVGRRGLPAVVEALSARTWFGLAGLGLAATGAAALTPNPVSAARRRALERELLVREQDLVRQSRARVIALLDEHGVAIPDLATQDSTAATRTPRRSTGT